LFAFADDKLIDQDTALKITTGFGGGVALSGDICGACSAGVMVLGLIYGRGIKEDKSYKINTYKKVQKFLELFKEKNNSIHCRENLNGCDLNTAEGNKLFKDNSYEEKVCMNCVSSSIEIIQELI
jgi:C_GCAxxG_C_C family probable redox protein